VVDYTPPSLLVILITVGWGFSRIPVLEHSIVVVVEFFQVFVYQISQKSQFRFQSGINIAAVEESRYEGMLPEPWELTPVWGGP